MLTSDDFPNLIRFSATGTGGTGTSPPVGPVIDVPGKVTDLAATPGDGEVALTWSAPSSDGGSAITDYAVQYRTSPSGSWSTFADGTSATPGATVTPLTNASTYDFEVAAVNIAGTGPWSDPVTETPESTAPSLPALDAIVAHYDSAAITPQADGTALAQWDDASGSGAHAAQATGANQPKYRTDGANGRAYVEFAGGTAQWLAIATPGALRTAMDTQNYTVLAVVEAATGAPGANIFGVGAGGSSPSLWAGGTNIGWASSNIAGSTVPHGAGAGYMTLGLISDTTTQAVSAFKQIMRNIFRGAIYNSHTNAASVTNGKTLAIGAGNIDASPTFAFKGRVYRIIVWDRPLTAAELMQAEAYFCWFYGQTHPSVTLGRHLYLDGDSRTAGVGSSALDGTLKLAYKVAAGLGHPLGTYSVYAIGGAKITELIAKGGEIDGAAQALAALDPAMAHRLIYEEFFNNRTLAVGDLATPNTLAYLTAQYLAERRAGMPSSLKIMGQSPFDHVNTQNPQPSAWAAYIQANYAALGLDGLADVWGSVLGGDDACPNSAPYTPYWGDGIHLTPDGQTVQAGIIVDACDALAGW